MCCIDSPGLASPVFPEPLSWVTSFRSHPRPTCSPVVCPVFTVFPPHLSCAVTLLSINNNPWLFCIWVLPLRIPDTDRINALLLPNTQRYIMCRSGSEGSFSERFRLPLTTTALLTINTIKPLGGLLLLRKTGKGVIGRRRSRTCRD